MQDIGFSARKPFDKLELKLDPRPEGASINMGFTKIDFRESYQWLKKMARKLRANLDRRFQEEIVWTGLRTLTHPAVWRNVQIPADALGKISRHLGIGQVELETAWTDMRPKVFSRLGPPPPGAELCNREFRSSMLLPALAECQPSTLRTLIVVSVATSGNSAQMERDMKALRDLWHKRTKKLCPLRLGKQMRLSLNYKERSEGRAYDKRRTLRSLAADIKAAWDNGERTHRDGQSGQRKRERSDRGQKHSEAKRRFESHLSEGDVAALCDGMASAGSQVMISQRDVKGGTDVLGPDLLDGL